MSDIAAEKYVRQLSRRVKREDDAGVGIVITLD